jgi:acyl-CoA synthetase (AMP-forming)/AMP-acid ligase II
VHAVVVCKPGAQVSEAEIRAHTKTLIAGYKAPRTVEFVGTLPVTPIVKVLKRQLRAKVPDRNRVPVNQLLSTRPMIGETR